MNKSGDNYSIALSKESQSFLKNDIMEINAPNPAIYLQKDDDIFLKFNDLMIVNDALQFTNLEVYEYFENIEKEEKGKVTWYVPNDFGGILKCDGTEFIYKGNTYVDSKENLSKDDKQYFVDIYDEQLLFEEYKSIIPPLKWYNMVNPQETFFDIIVDIYKNKR